MTDDRSAGATGDTTHPPGTTVPPAPADLEAENRTAARTSPIIHYSPEADVVSVVQTRRNIGYILLGFLAALILLAFLELIYINASGPVALDKAGRVLLVGGTPVRAAGDDAADAARLVSLMNIVFGPVITLVSSVVGFYFGAKTAKENG